MKSIIKSILNMLSLLLGICFILVSCEYEELADADYPEQVVYMPTAAHGIYDVSVASDIVAVPTPGNPYRYLIDNSSNKLTIPLGVYRSGVNNKGSFSVKITAITDTIAELIADGTLVGTEILPSGIYSVPASVTVEDSKGSQIFNMDVDLNFLKSNPDKKYAVGVEISGSERTVNAELSTTVILVNTQSLIY